MPQPPKTRAEFEKLLRDGGFSNRQAKRIASEGFHPAAADVDAGDDDAALLFALQDATLQLRDGVGSVRNERPGTTE